MPQIDNISSPDWSLSITDADALVQGLDDIRQCLDIIFQTEKGSDPLRPEFGCGILTYIDKPSNVAIPNMIREMINAVKLWEPRATVTSIVPEIDATNPGKIKFTVKWKAYLSTGQNTVIYG